MSHSKRNTSLAFFTSHERSLLKSHWGSQSTRLSRDSFLPFASCNLCLQPSISPVVCATNGELFCRECIISNLLSQRKEIKRLEKEAQSRREREEEEGRERGHEEGERAVLEFEKTMMGLEAPMITAASKEKNKAMGKNPAVSAEDEKKNPPVPSDVEQGSKGVKRKHFSLDEATMLQNAQHERAKARRAIEAESAAKDTLPSFWVPALTPSTGNDTRNLPPSATNDSPSSSIPLKSLHPLCPGSSSSPSSSGAPPTKPHTLSLKTLIDVQFKPATTITTASSPSSTDKPTTETKYICPCCNKTLTNALKAVIAIPCGHVLCKPCAGKFMSSSTPNNTDPHDMNNNDDSKEMSCRCFVCEANLSETPAKKKKGGKKGEGGVRPGVVELRCEGTGFAGGGGNIVGRAGTVFQC